MSDQHYIWIVIGIILIALEIFGLSGIGFIFIGLGSISLGGLLVYNIIKDPSIFSQLSILILCSLIWTGILWYPFKKLKSNKKGFLNIIGQRATVYNTAIKAGEIGEISWSGSVMQAKISANSTELLIESGKIVYTGLPH